MTTEEVQEFIDNYCQKIRLFGFTSTSQVESVAKNFAWDNTESGHHKVVFEIHYEDNWGKYYLNGGAYDYEEEVLIRDG